MRQQVPEKTNHGKFCFSFHEFATTTKNAAGEKKQSQPKYSIWKGKNKQPKKNPSQVKKMSREAVPPFSTRARSIVAGAIYQHYKGDQYRIISVARHSETLQELIVYQALYGPGHVWVRPLDMFLEDVTIDNKPHPRFRPVCSQETSAKTS